VRNWYPTIWVGGLNQALAMYEIRGNQVFRSPWHPEGMSATPVFEIRGNQVFRSPWHPEGMSATPVLETRSRGRQP
jgi:hypothetical protein